MCPWFQKSWGNKWICYWKQHPSLVRLGLQPWPALWCWHILQKETVFSYIFHQWRPLLFYEIEAEIKGLIVDFTNTSISKC
jgi:hypothetical protein